MSREEDEGASSQRDDGPGAYMGMGMGSPLLPMDEKPLGPGGRRGSPEVSE